MASRSFDGKDTLLFGKGRGLMSTMWRHLADSGLAAGEGEPGGRGKMRKPNGQRGIELLGGVEKKKLRFPEACEA